MSEFGFGEGPFGLYPFGEDYTLDERPAGTHPRQYLGPYDQGPTLTGGVIKTSARVYRSNIQNDLIEQLDVGSSSKVDIDIDRAVKGTCQLDLRAGTDIPNWSWVAVFIDVERESGDSLSHQVGLFRMESRRGVSRASDTSLSIPGEDATVLLHNKKFPDVYNIPSGSNKVTVLASIVAGVGLVPSFPNSTATYDEDKSFKAGSSAWEICAEILKSMGWYAPIAVNNRILSFGYRSATTSSPARTYTIGHDSRILGDPSFDRNESSFANQIIMLSEGPDRDPLIAVMTNNDPRSIASTTHPDGPGVVSLVLSDNDIEDQSVLDSRALHELENRTALASMDVVTLIDPRLSVFDVVKVVPVYDHMVHLSGTWLVQQIGLRLGDGTMVLKTRRNELYG